MEMICTYATQPQKVIQSKTREISIFNINGENIDKRVVDEFGEEWLKFNDFTDKHINAAAEEYFDIIDNTIVNKNTYVLDIGCGTGRWTKYLASRARFIEAVDPSDAIFAADNLLRNVENVRLSKASVDTLPFPDETFDFAMSIGVLHHVPNTQQALIDCVKKVKKGGYFYVYLYYNLDKRGKMFRTLFRFTDIIRNIICKFPSGLKKFVCDILAIIIYMPLILFARFLFFVNLKKLAKKIPLSAYSNHSFFIIRNDALDRFGTRLEQRFSKNEIKEMMTTSGLDQILVSDGTPFYHAIGKKV